MEAVKLRPMYAANDENSAIVRDIQENYATGYVRLFRSIRKHWIWDDAEKLKWWLDILLECNHADKKSLIGGVLIECKRGQSINSLQTWGKRWRTDKSAVRRFFKLLEGDGMIRTENVSKTTRLTVCNYGTYNDVRNDDETQTKRRRNADDTKQECKELKEDIKGAAAPPKKSAFVPPTVDDVKKYVDELTKAHYNSDKVAQNFMDFYQGKGWMVGKTKMSDWKATVRNCLQWEKNQKLLNERKSIANQTGLPGYLNRPIIFPENT
jgi:hypothetical protein